MATATGWRQELSLGTALQTIVRQATQALIAMDADRLEELARCCFDLNRDRPGASPQDHQSSDFYRGSPTLLEEPVARDRVQHGVLPNNLITENLMTDYVTRDELQGSMTDSVDDGMKVLALVLIETRANLKVMSELERRRLPGSVSSDRWLTLQSRVNSASVSHERTVHHGDN